MKNTTLENGFAETSSANVKHKNSVFNLLFSDPDVLRELYSAIEGVTLPSDIPVTINTLQNVFFMGIYNDISFEIGGKIVVLIEHQSTINPNMALRFLMYISRIYETIVEGSRLYSSKKVTIPRPEFYVLYNGKKDFPDKTIIKLTDLFEDADLLGVSADIPALELEVKVLNINEGRNADITGRCRILEGYSILIGKIREYQEEGMPLEVAIPKALQYCVKHGILSEFLTKNSSGVIGMLMTEWNWDDALEVRYNEGIEIGEQRILNLLKSGKSPEEIITNYGKEGKLIGSSLTQNNLE